MYVQNVFSKFISSIISRLQNVQTTRRESKCRWTDLPREPRYAWIGLTRTVMRTYVSRALHVGDTATRPQGGDRTRGNEIFQWIDVRSFLEYSFLEYHVNPLVASDDATKLFAAAMSRCIFYIKAESAKTNVSWEAENDAGETQHNIHLQYKRSWSQQQYHYSNHLARARAHNMVEHVHYSMYISLYIDIHFIIYHIVLDLYVNTFI